MASKVQMISVSIADAKDAIVFCIKAGKNVYIEGPSGLGKTELLGQIAAELSAKMYTSRLAQLEPSDIVGFPMPEKVGEDYVMTFSRPTSIPPRDDSDQLYLWFFDELNRANKQSINSVMQATDSCKRVGSHSLPRNTVVIGAGNPPNDDAYDTSQLDAAVNNRYVHIKIHYCAKALGDYAKKKEWHENVQSFLQVSGNKVFDGVYEGLPFTSPRSLEAMSGLEHSGLGRDKALHALLAQGTFGPTVGMMYHSHCFELQPLKWKEIGTKEGKERLAKMIKPDNVRMDLLNFTNDDIFQHFVDQDGKMTDKEFKTLEGYLLAIPADQAAALISILRNNVKTAAGIDAHLTTGGQKISDYLGTLRK